MTTISQEALGKRKSYFSGAAASAATYSNNKKCNKKKRNLFSAFRRKVWLSWEIAGKKLKLKKKNGLEGKKID